MFQFIGFAFLYLIPLVLLLWILPFVPHKQLAVRLVTIMQFSMLFYSFFLVRQIMGLWELSKFIGVDQAVYRPSFYSMATTFLLIVLPFFFLYRGWFGKIWAAMTMWVLLFVLNGFVTIIDHPIFVVTKLLFYVSLLVALYALVWLYKKFPDQSVS